MRWKDKGGIQDLQKAQHFLNKYLEIQHQLKDHVTREREQLQGKVDDWLMKAAREQNAAGKLVQKNRGDDVIAKRAAMDALEKADKDRKFNEAMTTDAWPHPKDEGAEPGRGYVNQDR